VEYGPRGVRANMVSPGTICTSARSWLRRLERDPQIFEKLARWYPVGRVGRPEDIAGAVAYLGSDEAGFVNGQIWSWMAALPLAKRSWSTN
jgi:meso-butanediol dehydrogenase / (S,S)-butanediol dehydrogenase / diacetyl reductase